MLSETVIQVSGRAGDVVEQNGVVDQIRNETGRLAQVKLSYEADLKILWLTINPEPKPVFTLQVLQSVVAVQRAIIKLWGGPRGYETCPVRFLAYRGEGPVFTLGGDLDFYLD